MRMTPTGGNPGSPSWDSFALVTYIPDPLGSLIKKLQQMLPGAVHPEAHITLLPPRALGVPHEEVCADVARILQRVSPFEVELGTIRVFTETDIAYVSVESGRLQLLSLHEALNTGGLSANEQFEYIPHLTLGGPLSVVNDISKVLAEIAQMWESGPSRRLEVRELVLLCQPGGRSDGNWSRIGSYRLTQT
jgi:2'-5' RNA ligase